ncbi:hypothetical protein CC77DRAFT_166788 [Alternaria alternata]|uniref:Uncharacterized protein n=1 Tax=Alternaria alternata TaxID=5599 RepID=A0A177DIF2_ALTAL|nr:hypothetical protein CC77DRAFT_166788 [Alternaria alternata]KAH6846211.1 hypothetical protein B0T12DRAFT_219524 [Alternaria alternata]OAG19465.1 hypothetical protein CC77DRAFT_166788 [Alternaria alternata]
METIALRNQAESPLLRLPGEIRNRIYDYVFRAECIVVLEPGTHTKYICRLYNRGAARSYQPLCTLLQSRLVCRQYYAETRLLVFQNNRLCVDIWNLRGLLEMIPKDVQNAISTLCIYGCSYCDLDESLFLPGFLVNFRKVEPSPWVSSPYNNCHEFFRRITR